MAPARAMAEALARPGLVRDSLTSRRLWALGLIGGAGLALSASPFDAWPAVLLGVIAGFALWRRATTPWAAALAGWGFGLGYFGVTLVWIVEPFMVDAAATGWMAPFGLIGMAGGLALFWALAFGLARRITTQGGAFGLVVLWALAELARAYVLTGFPWALPSYGWLESPVIQWVSVLGPHGLWLATLALAAGIEGTLHRRSLSGALWALSGLLVLGLGGLALRPAPQDLTDQPVVRLIQPNAPQDEKWRPDRIPVFYNRLLDLTEAPAAQAPDLIVWPETALPMLLDQAAPAFEQIGLSAQGAPVVLGIQRYDGGFYNSLVVLDRAGQVTELYDKAHLVPFGEYMPLPGLFSRLGITGLAARAEAGYSAGPGPRLLDLGPLGRALPLICYEAVFPQDLNAAPARPDWLVQITNDAWFGSWSGPYQHLAQARIRAIEQGLPMLRAANTGVSAMIDPAGRVLAEIALNSAGFVDAPLPRPRAATVYSLTGDLPVFVLLSLALVGFMLQRGQRGGRQTLRN